MLGVLTLALGYVRSPAQQREAHAGSTALVGDATVSDALAEGAMLKAIDTTPGMAAPAADAPTALPPGPASAPLPSDAAAGVVPPGDSAPALLGDASNLDARQARLQRALGDPVARSDNNTSLASPSGGEDPSEGEDPAEAGAVRRAAADALRPQLRRQSDLRLAGAGAPAAEGAVLPEEVSPAAGPDADDVPPRGTGGGSVAATGPAIVRRVR